jgi:hypothetical protein
MTTINKTLLPSKDVYIQFTEDELIELNLNAGDKFTVKPHENGFIFEKKVPLEIDLSEFDVEILRRLVGESLEKDLPVGEIITQALEKSLGELDYPDSNE